MITYFCQKKLENLIDGTDIEIDRDIIINNPKALRDIVFKGKLGVGESYRDGLWDSPDLKDLFVKIFESKLDQKVKSLWTLPQQARTRILNMQNPFRSRKVADEHYNVGNKLYRLMLGPTMQYTCAFWDNANTLEQAQENKMRLVCEKLHLKKNDHVLELGGGWGTLAKFMAEEYGCHVDSYNIADEQVKFAREKTTNLKQGRVNIFHKDYREATGTYDKIASVGLCEHIGRKNHRTLFEVAHKTLTPEGLLLVHTIGKNITQILLDPFINKYIFANGQIPSEQELASASEELFIEQSSNNIGPDYVKTLAEWRKRFIDNWEEIKGKDNGKIRYDIKFKRSNIYYLATSEASFEKRRLQLYQKVYSKDSYKGKYKPVITTKST